MPTPTLEDFIGQTFRQLAQGLSVASAEVGIHGGSFVGPGSSFVEVACDIAIYPDKSNCIVAMPTADAPTEASRIRFTVPVKFRHSRYSEGLATQGQQSADSIDPQTPALPVATAQQPGT